MEIAKEKSTKKDNRRDIKWCVVIILTAIFITLWIATATGYINKLDDDIYRIVEGFRTNWLTKILIIITELGGIIGLFLVLVISIVFLMKKNRKKEAIGITLNLLFSTFVYVLLKQIFQRPRPITGNILVEETGFSFPSGHTTNNVAFYTFAIYLICLNVKNKKIRNMSCIILTIIPILIGFSRIYLRVHYPSDVMAGFCLGIIVVILFSTFIYPKIRENVKEEK